MNANIKNSILLIIRIVIGGMITYAGYTKLMDMDSSISSLNQAFGLSAITVWAVAIGELLSGLGIVFGVWTRLAATGAIVIMLGAVYYTKGQDMSALLTLIGLIVLGIVGGGKWAIATCNHNNREDNIVPPSMSEEAKF